jgi:hypothetical protein
MKSLRRSVGTLVSNGGEDGQRLHKAGLDKDKVKEAKHSIE